jgi:hypothetical protein
MVRSHVPLCDSVRGTKACLAVLAICTGMVLRICCDRCKRLVPHILNVPRTGSFGMNYILRLTSSDIQIRAMADPQSLRHPLFRRRWFTDEVIITCVRWYLRSAK